MMGGNEALSQRSGDELGSTVPDTRRTDLPSIAAIVSIGAQN